jgi:hypothetical protein
MACRRGCSRRWASWIGAAQEGLLALSVGVALGVVHELMEEEARRVVGRGSAAAHALVRRSRVGLPDHC